MFFAMKQRFDWLILYFGRDLRWDHLNGAVARSLLILRLFLEFGASTNANACSSGKLHACLIFCARDLRCSS
jgi:hypothetical protein